MASKPLETGIPTPPTPTHMYQDGAYYVHIPIILSHVPLLVHFSFLERHPTWLCMYCVGFTRHPHAPGVKDKFKQALRAQSQSER